MKKIGSLKIKNSVFLAPMADYTNIAFRELCVENGAGLVYTELISTKGILHKSKKTPSLLAVSKKEKPIFLQLFGNNPLEFKKAIEFVENEYPKNFAGFDLNAGCSVPKAQNGMYGSYLLDYPELIGKIVAEMKSATDKPITLKMRLGLKKETYIECAKVAEKNGVDAIALHARLGVDGYSGKANWEKIKKLKENISIPIIGNGDIVDYSSAVLMKEETDCDFVMVGRAAIGNAFVFKQINSALSGKKIPELNSEQKKKEARNLLDKCVNYNLGVNDARGYFLGWCKGFSGASKIRNEIALAKNIHDFRSFLL